MNNKGLIIIGPKDINTCKTLVQKKRFQWLFMGADACLREKIVSTLGSENRHCYAQELQDVCIEYKQPFLDWLAQVGKLQSGFYWWATGIAYKNPLACDLFLNFCCLVLINRWIENQIKNRVIIIENPWLIKACYANFNGRTVHIVRNSGYLIASWIKRQLTSIARLGFFFGRSIGMWVINRAFGIIYHKQIKDIVKDHIDIVVCTWLERRSFKGVKNRFIDPYLGSLAAYYEKQGSKVITTTLPVFPLKLLKRAFKSKRIIPSMYFVRISDVIRSFTATLVFRKKRNIPLNGGLDISTIFAYEWIWERGKACYGILQYFAFLNLFNKNKLSFSVLIYPFENQPWDKMMVLAKHASHSSSKIIGCHNIGVPLFYLNFFLGEGEADACPQPDIIVSNGSYWKEVFKTSGFSCTIENGGSVRFGAVLNKNGKEVEDQYENIERDSKVLVLLSTSLYYSLDLMFYLIHQAQRDKTFYIKPHPDTPEKVIRKYVGKLPKNFVFVSGSMDEWMGQVGWAIHVGTTAAIECMMNGIKVFKYLPERVDMDPLLGLNIEQKIVTDLERIQFYGYEQGDVPDSNLIAEPFNKKIWDGVIENAQRAHSPSRLESGTAALASKLQ